MGNHFPAGLHGLYNASFPCIQRSRLTVDSTFTCIGVVPVSNQIILDLEGSGDKSASVLLVTIWELGEAAGPLLIGPLSEVYGRYPVYNVANLLFVLTTATSALSGSATLLIFSRFLTGCAVAANALNPSIIGDVLPPERRGSAMSLIFLAPLLGGAVGPAIAGAVAQTLGWRQVLWLAALIAGVCEVAFLTLFRETYRPTILRRRAARLRRMSTVSVTVADDAVTEGKEATVWESIKRPAQVFSNSFVLQILCLYGAFGFTFFYIMSTTLPDILGEVYGFTPSAVGGSFLCFSVGSTFGIMLCNFALDKIYVRLGDKNNGVAEPEHRLPILILGAFMFPIPVTLYGWAAQGHWPVGIFLFIIGWIGFSVLVAVVPVMSYVVDGFGMYSASAMTAILISRCLTSTFLPLAVTPLTRELGYGLGFTVLGLTMLCLAPIPVAVMRYGVEWRERSSYTKKA